MSATTQQKINKQKECEAKSLKSKKKKQLERLCLAGLMGESCPPHTWCSAGAWQSLKGVQTQPSKQQPIHAQA